MGKKILFYSIPYLILLLILAGIELYVKFTKPHIPSIQVYVAGETHGDDHAGAQTFEGDPLLGWRLKANLKDQWWDWTTLSTNSQHLRHPTDLKKKDPNVLRIVCLGDSVTFGYRVPQSSAEAPLVYEAEALSYPRLLENKIAALSSGRKAEVIAMAVPGYSSYQGLAWLRRDIGWMKPDILMVSFGWNDTDGRPVPDKEAFPTGSGQVFLKWLSAQSQAVIYASRWLREKNKGAATIANQAIVRRVSGDDYVENMLAIARLAEEHAAKPIIIAQVYGTPVGPHELEQVKYIRQNRLNLEHAAVSAGIPFIRMGQLIEEPGTDNLHLFGWKDPIHPNKDGHRIMAQALYDFLISKRMLEN